MFSSSMVVLAMFSFMIVLYILSLNQDDPVDHDPQRHPPDSPGHPDGTNTLA